MYFATVSIYRGGTSTIYADSAETSLNAGHLYSITTGGVVTDVGSNGSTDTHPPVTIGNYGDLAYDGLTLYGSFDTEVVHGSATYQGRVTITGDQAGTVALQGTFTYLGNNVLMDGLAYYNGIFYGVNRGNNIYAPSTLYTILPDGTIANAVAITGLMSDTNIYGMTATPIPPSVFLLGSGLLGLGALGWRRRQG
jgi:hypothetical protein